MAYLVKNPNEPGRDVACSSRYDADMLCGHVYRLTGVSCNVHEVYKLNGVIVPENLRILLGKASRDGHVIQSIKAVRDLTGSGLKDAKDFVDACRAHHG